MAKLIGKRGYTIGVIVKFSLLPFILRVTLECCRGFFLNYYTVQTELVYSSTKLGVSYPSSYQAIPCNF